MKEIKQGKTFVCGDIHGNYKGFSQALERANFDNENDTLISLGDVVDGHCDSFEVVEKLLSIKKLIAIKGNHDDWFNQWIETGFNPSQWQQGQKATGMSYLEAHNPELPWMALNKDMSGFEVGLKVEMLPATHIKFFKEQLPYYLDDKDRLFIHGGFNRHFHLDDQDESLFWWDRDLWGQALSWQAMVGMSTPLEDTKYVPKFKMQGDFKEVYIGHTSTQFWGENKPMQAANIWNLDTGGGWLGFISIMDIDTKEVWQSDDAKSLYPEFKGR